MVEELQAPFDQALYDSMVAKNEEELKKFDDKAVDAEQNQGETEVNEAFLSKADYYAKIGDKVSKATFQLKQLYNKKLGKRFDSIRKFIKEVNHIGYSHRYCFHLCSYWFLL